MRFSLIFICFLLIFGCSEKKQYCDIVNKTYSIDSIDIQVKVPDNFIISQGKQNDRLVIFDRDFVTKDSLIKGFIIVDDFSSFINGFQDINQYSQFKRLSIMKNSKKWIKKIDTLYQWKEYDIGFINYYVEYDSYNCFEGYLLVSKGYRQLTFSLKSMVKDSSKIDKDYMDCIHKSICKINPR